MQDGRDSEKITAPVLFGLRIFLAVIFLELLSALIFFLARFI